MNWLLKHLFNYVVVKTVENQINIDVRSDFFSSVTGKWFPLFNCIELKCVFIFNDFGYVCVCVNNSRHSLNELLFSQLIFVVTNAIRCTCTITCLIDFLSGLQTLWYNPKQNICDWKIFLFCHGNALIFTFEGFIKYLETTPSI